MVHSILIHLESCVQSERLFEATLVGIFKKGDWRGCHFWPPISMCKALCRVALKCLISSVTKGLEGWVINTRFGARNELGFLQATFCLQDMMKWEGMNFDKGYALHLDMQNAFSSIPLPLVIRMLPNIGLPNSVYHVVTVALTHVRVTDRGARQW